MATKKQLQERYDKAVEKCAETADKYSDAVDKIEELTKTLAETESYCKDFENRIHELVGEKHDLNKELITAFSLSDRVKSELENMTEYCNKMQKYIVGLAMDGVIKGDDY